MRKNGWLLALVLLTSLACDSSSDSKKGDVQTDAADSQTQDETVQDLRADDSLTDALLDDSTVNDLTLDAEDAVSQDVAPDSTDVSDATPDVTQTCPEDLWELEGTECSQEGLQCGGENCVNICGFCNIMMCSGSVWSHLEAFPMECVAHDMDTCIYVEELWNGCVSDMTTCEEVESLYSYYVENAGASCTTDSDCQVLNGQCSYSLGGCYEAVNLNVTQEVLSSLGWQYGQLGCTSAVCDCAPPPSQAVCNEGFCQIP